MAKGIKDSTGLFNRVLNRRSCATKLGGSGKKRHSRGHLIGNLVQKAETSD
jgi:hypothetical protein